MRDLFLVLATVGLTTTSALAQDATPANAPAADGSWKFVSVMGYPEKLESAAPVSHPCE